MSALPRLRSWHGAEHEPELEAGAGPDTLTPALAELYGGGLAFPARADARPYVYANFVATLDGVVSFGVPGQSGGGTISQGDSGDRFIMGLLRASADAIMVGAATLAPVALNSLWLPESVCPEARELYAAYNGGRAPLLVIVSGGGRVNLERAVFRTPHRRALILTGADGAQRLAGAGAGQLPGLEVRALPSGPSSAAGIEAGIDPGAMLALLAAEYGVRRLLHEGGPTLVGGFLRAGVLDELFLTLSPHLAGRDRTAPRPGLVEGLAFPPATAPGCTLISGKQCGDYLYLRYRLKRQP